MLFNLILLVVLFGAQRKKLHPYVAALLLGSIKFAVYLIFSKNLGWALIVGGSFAALGSAVVHLIGRLDKSETEDASPIPDYRPPGSRTIEFRWEYIPLVIVILFILFGEMVF